MAALTAEHFAILAEAEKRAHYRLRSLFPATGLYRRDLYPKHLAFMAAGAVHRERCFLAGNRTGKTEAGAYETSLHLTGCYDEYAPWWQGRRFSSPIRMWAAGDTSKTTRDIIQDKLCGPPDKFGSGLIPAHLIEDKSTKAGIPDALDTVWVKHKSGGLSVVQFKSYDQRREAFQGTSQHVIWLDEECPEDIYSECLIRTAETSDFDGGMILLTFTPLLGVTPLVLSFLPGGQLPI